MEDGLKRVRDATDELRAMIAESQHVIAESVQLLEFVQALQSPLIPTEPPLRCYSAWKIDPLSRGIGVQN